jgi:hypothetical protein
VGLLITELNNRQEDAKGVRELQKPQIYAD